MVESAEPCLPTAPTGADRDWFLSDEDLDLANLSWDELLGWWDEMLRQAQASNDLDEHEYSPACWPCRARNGRGGRE